MLMKMKRNGTNEINRTITLDREQKCMKKINYLNLNLSIENQGESTWFSSTTSTMSVSMTQYI